MASGVAESAATEVALGRISGAVPSGLGSWALRTTGAASGAFVMAFWPSELGDGTLYTDEQLRAMSRAITRVRFRFIEDEQGKMQVYGIHTSAAGRERRGCGGSWWPNPDMVPGQQRRDP